MLFYPDSFKVSTPSDRQVAIERDLDAPRQLVFDAFTKPELVRRWLLGPEGWTMPVCEIDLRPGGAYRYVWRKASTNTQMGMGGVFREVVSPERIVATEKFDEAWYPGDAVNTTEFEERGGTTKVRVTVLYESKEARDTATRSGMERGMIAGYDRLEQLLARRREYRPGGAGDARAQKDGDRWQLVFVREFSHPPARVWAALTDPTLLREWSPFDPDRDLGSPGPVTLTMAGGTGDETFPSTVKRADAPRRLEYTWGEDLLQWELEPTAAGTKLTLRHFVSDTSWLSKVAAGWHICLDVAELALADRHVGRIVADEAMQFGWDRLNEEYDGRFTRVSR